jgi:hypothetical protein
MSSRDAGPKGFPTKIPHAYCVYKVKRTGGSYCSSRRKTQTGSKCTLEESCLKLYGDQGQEEGAWTMAPSGSKRGDGLGTSREGRVFQTEASSMNTCIER